MVANPYSCPGLAHRDMAVGLARTNTVVASLLHIKTANISTGNLAPFLVQDHAQAIRLSCLGTQLPASPAAVFCAAIPSFVSGQMLLFINLQLTLSAPEDPVMSGFPTSLNLYSASPTCSISD